MATLREVFVNWQVKSNLAQQMKLLDKAIDETSDEFKKMADEAEKSAKETAEAWGKVGDRAKDIGGKIRDGIGIGLTAIAGVATAITAMTVQWAQGAAQIESTARQFGISAQSLQEWQYAAKASGGEAEGILGIFKELNLRLAEVGETGTGSAADALKLLGIGIKEIRSLKPEQQMEMIADRLSMISDVGNRTFIKDSLFGGEYEKIGNLLEQGADGIATLRKEANELGGVLDGEALRGAKEFNRELVKTEAVIEGVKSELAQGALPVLREWIRRGSEWIKNNRELIATKANEWIARFGKILEEVVPLAEKLVDATFKLVDAIGGADNAIKIAAGGWAAWQLAGLAAIGAVGQALAVFTASFAAGMALADRFNGGPQTRAQNARDQRELAKFKTATDLLQANQGDSGDPTVERAKRLLLAELDSLNRIQGSGVGATRTRQRQGAIDDQFAAVERAKAALESAIKESDAALTVLPDTPGSVRLGRISQGGETPLTTEQLLKDQRKREAEQTKLRAIRSDLEARRFSASGTERMTIERTLADVNRRLSGVDLQTPEQLIAGLVGQGTGIGGGMLRPAGLGTSINQIDASITINVGGIDVDIPMSALNPSDPRGSAQNIGQGIANYLTEIFGIAGRHQRAQING